MRSARWEPCSEVSINSELDNLREVRANLSECLNAMPENDSVRPRMAMALSFVEMAIDALNSFQAEQVFQQGR